MWNKIQLIVFAIFHAAQDMPLSFPFLTHLPNFYLIPLRLPWAFGIQWGKEVRIRYKRGILQSSIIPIIHSTRQLKRWHFLGPEINARNNLNSGLFYVDLCPFWGILLCGLLCETEVFPKNLILWLFWGSQTLHFLCWAILSNWLIFRR